MGRRVLELGDGEAFESFFVVTRSVTQTTRTGAEYLALTVKDRTGELQARVWDPSAACPGGISTGAVYRLRGRVERYREELQMNIEAAAPYSPIGLEHDELVRASAWPSDVLVAEIRTHVETSVRSPLLRALLHDVLDHPDVRTRLPAAAAASRNHHAYRGGLAEHTLSGMRLASTIAAHYAAYYPGLVDGDLLVAGVLLHDLAKIWEMSGDLDPQYTTPGKLLGHISIGAAFIERVASQRGDVPEVLVWELQHLILSHHGEYEFGSPKRPKTVEAQLLHYIDQIDAKANVFAHLVTGDDGWAYDRTARRPLLDPTVLRATWTSPPPGERHARGPGPVAPAATAAPVGPVSSAPASAATSGEVTAPIGHTETVTADSTGGHAGAEGGAAEASHSEAAASAEPRSPAVDRLTLSLFDGLE